MEAVIALILIALAIYVVFLIIVYIILPLASILAGITLLVAGVYGLAVSVKSFFDSVDAHKDPYITYKDNNTDTPVGVKRNYCFGPGYHQVQEIVSGAFKNLDEHRQGIVEWKDRAVGKHWAIDIFIYLGFIFAVISAQVLGFIWVAIFSIILVSVITIGMVGFFSFFSVLWITDRAVLLLKSIKNRCPQCKRISVIPVFVCPTCGAEHRRLVPGPYGVFKCKCSCGTYMATTFLGGRSKYEARCPFCDADLYSSSSMQYGIQLVGGVGTGKTTFLAAFWHEYREWLNNTRNIKYETAPEDAFTELEDWFRSGTSESTLETNASMYSIIHSLSSNSSVQMTIYDIAGEAFEYSGSEIQQQQFKYCEGFLLVIDPTSSPDIVAGTISNFINSFEEFIGKHSDRAKTVPVAVIITKSDLYKREIGITRIRSVYKQSVANGGLDVGFSKCRDDECRKFMVGHGFGNALNLIDGEFSNIRFFPVSSMGHESEAGQYEPWGVLDPVFWLMSSKECPLSSLIEQQG